MAVVVVAPQEPAATITFISGDSYLWQAPSVVLTPVRLGCTGVCDGCCPLHLMCVYGVYLHICCGALCAALVLAVIDTVVTAAVSFAISRLALCSACGDVLPLQCIFDKLWIGFGQPLFPQYYATQEDERK